MTSDDPVPPARAAEDPVPPAGDGGAPGEVAGRRTRRRGAVLGVLVLVVLGAAAALAARDGACPPPDAAVEVRGRVVTVAELERRVELLRALYGVRVPREDEPERLSAFRGDAAKAMAVAVLVDQEVAERELEAADPAVRDALDRFVADRYPEGGRDRFVEALGDEGVSEAEVRAEFRRLLETRRLFDAVTASVTVDAAAVAAAFEERKEQLARPERRQVRHLVVAGEDEARAALERLRAGEPFPEVAMDVSLDNATRADGGRLGPVAAAELDPAFADAAFAADEGEPFGPVRTDLGWHVGVVDEIIPGRPVALEEVREPLRERLLEERRLARWREFLADEIEAADACYADRFRPADPDAPPPDLDPALQPGG